MDLASFRVMKKLVLAGIILIWIISLALGLRLLANYDFDPGRVAMAPTHMPNMPNVLPEKRRPTLLVFAHPQCPCSRATISELAAIMTRAQGRVDGYVFFLQPSNLADDWYQTDLWYQTKAIPGIVAIRDLNGRYARLFHATTSGQTVLYSANGELVFEGGITLSRGHQGDNQGRRQILSFLTAKSTNQKRTPVYGCALFIDSSYCVQKGKTCKK